MKKRERKHRNTTIYMLAISSFKVSPVCRNIPRPVLPELSRINNLPQGATIQHQANNIPCVQCA